VSAPYTSWQDRLLRKDTDVLRQLTSSKFQLLRSRAGCRAFERALKRVPDDVQGNKTDWRQRLRIRKCLLAAWRLPRDRPLPRFFSCRRRSAVGDINSSLGLTASPRTNCSTCLFWPGTWSCRTFLPHNVRGSCSYWRHACWLWSDLRVMRTLPMELFELQKPAARKSGTAVHPDCLND
jgi:hypothetical protein